MKLTRIKSIEYVIKFESARIRMIGIESIKLNGNDSNSIDRMNYLNIESTRIWIIGIKSMKLNGIDSN